MLRGLSMWLGAIQSIHLILLVVEFNRFSASQPFLILARNDQAWTPGNMSILLILGGIDALLAILSLYFVCTFLRNGRLRRTLGVVVLGVFHVSAFIYLIVTVSAGVWWQHPIPYGTMACCFVPISLLMVQLIRTNQNYRSEGELP